VCSEFVYIRTESLRAVRLSARLGTDVWCSTPQVKSCSRLYPRMSFESHDEHEFAWESAALSLVRRHSLPSTSTTCRLPTKSEHRPTLRWIACKIMRTPPPMFAPISVDLPTQPQTMGSVPSEPPAPELTYRSTQISEQCVHLLRLTYLSSTPPDNVPRNTKQF
jgi:hypothetical protein